MASIKQIRRGAMSVTVGFFGALGVALRGLGKGRLAAVSVRPLAAQSELFARACAENPNRAMDWLYYASQLADDERRHCVARALELAGGDPVVLAEARRLS